MRPHPNILILVGLMFVASEPTVLAEVANGSAACAGENPFRQEHYLLLNLALGGAGGPVNELDFPTRYLVDYVRVYQ